MTKRTLPDTAILIPDHATCVFHGALFDVYQWQQEMFDGTYETFEMLRRPDTIAVIAIVPVLTVVAILVFLMLRLGRRGGRVAAIKTGASDSS